MRLTEEQQAVVASDADFLKVAAFAGTGKTSTLVEYAKARPNIRMLYAAFNKAVQIEAEQKFPKNVLCLTTHALAFATHGKKYRPKLVNRSLRPLEIFKALGPSFRGKQRNYRFAGRVQRALLDYLASEFETLDESFARHHANGAMTQWHLDILAAAQVIWNRMCDPTDMQIGMLHDGYLKLFQLSKPRLQYQCVLFDEAQDANPVTTDIFASQQCKRVFVGDSHQQIYSFRGAVDAMRRSDFTEALYLTHSFRFRSNVANVANVILALKGETERVKGVRSRDPSKTSAFITRGNAALFEKAAELVKSGGHPCFIGGIAGYNFEIVRDIYFLYEKDKDSIRDAFVRNFDSFDDLTEYANALNERDLIAWIRVVNKFTKEIPELVDLIKSRNEPIATKADLCLATAHKSKGLEFGSVELASDFPTYGFDRKQGFVHGDVEELNLLYVASTRAEQSLKINSTLEQLQTHLREVPHARHYAPAAVNPDSGTPQTGSSPSNPIDSQNEVRDAREIITLLASGLDPWSHARLADNQIVTRPEVQSALRAILESHSPASNSGPDVPNSTKSPGRAGRPWDEIEDGDLRKEVAQKMSIGKISQLHSRTKGAIRSRLVRLGLA